MAFLAPAVAAFSGAVSTAAGALGITVSAAAVQSAIVQIGASFLVNSFISAVFGKTPKVQDKGAELAQETTDPDKRFVYGEARATGTPAGTPVDGKFIYGAWILNSRPSHLPDFKMFLDKREVLLTGDAFTLTGSGATATDGLFDGNVTVWIGRGDQTAPPTAFTTEAPYVEGTDDDLWKTSDAWEGATVIWLKLDAGNVSDRNERWKSRPPLVEVEGKWSKVYDPREVSHDPADPDTWEWSENHALCVRDALRQNPIRVYEEEQIHPSFDEDGPDACDEAVALDAGGTEARYICSGTVVWSEGEVEDQLNPMMISGAADFVRIGGKLGYAAGVYRAPSETMTYLLGETASFPDMLPGAELFNRLRVTYASPARGYETAELLAWDIPGALAADGGIPTVKTVDLPFCPSATQAMRVRKISGLRARRQERVEGGTLPPEAFNLVGGSTVTIAYPAPYDALDGIYEVEGIHPGLDPMGESGMALRMTATLVKHSADIYAWTPATDEEEVFNEGYDDSPVGVAVPGTITVTSGGDINWDTGGSITPYFRFEFEPSTSESVYQYEWEWRIGTDEYQFGGVVDAENALPSGDYFFPLVVRGIEDRHDVRVRAVSPTGRSDWVEFNDSIYEFELTGVAGTALPGAATFTGTTSDSAIFRGVRVYRSAVGAAFETAVLVGALVEFDSDSAFSITAGTPGTDEITNGDFDTATGWTFGGNWSHDTDKATHTGTSLSVLEQALTLTDGADYRLSWTLSGSSGNFRVRLDGDTDADDLEGGDGLKTAILTAPANVTRLVVRAADPGSVDKISLIEDNGNMLTIGEADYWVVPVTLTGTNGQASGPITLTIP